MIACPGCGANLLFDIASQPMKHLSNACIALMAGLMLTLARVFRLSSTFRKADETQVIGATALAFATAAVVSRGQRREYHPPSSDSGSSCSSCGGSSCSSCGGGGSSSF